MKRILLFVLCAMLMGCATTADREEALDSWMGSDINQFISDNGYPQNSLTLPNGNKVYMWSDASGDWWCKTFLETDSTGRLVNWRFKGNSCY